MRTTRARLVGIVLIGLMLGACSAEPSPTPPIIPPTVLPSPARTLGPNEYWLPADPGLVLGPGATPMACAGVGLDAVLTGSSDDSRKVWLTDTSLGGRLDLVWPTGYSVRFGQGLEVLTAAGKIAMIGGSHVNGACVTGAENTYWLDTAFP